MTLYLYIHNRFIVPVVLYDHHYPYSRLIKMKICAYVYMCVYYKALIVKIVKISFEELKSCYIYTTMLKIAIINLLAKPKIQPCMMSLLIMSHFDNHIINFLSFFFCAYIYNIIINCHHYFVG